VFQLSGNYLNYRMCILCMVMAVPISHYFWVPLS
jgi:hypothetical protein